MCFCVTEVPSDTEKQGGDDDAQSLRDSILRSPGDESWSHHNRSDQGVYIHFDVWLPVNRLFLGLNTDVSFLLPVN